MARCFVMAFALLALGASGCTLSRSVVGGQSETDTGTSDGSVDAGMDAPLLDGGDDAGSDGGVDAGSDAPFDGGADVGLPDAWMPDPNGAACTASDECASGFCVDGVCCESACDGDCESCIAAADGVCAPIPGGSDPEDECAVDPEASCGSIGVCSGARACSMYGSTTVCAPSTCTGSTQTDPRTCDGAGSCADRGTTDCAPFACDGTVCFGSCADDGDCGAGLYCVVATGDCEPRLTDGQACSASTQCASSHCVDGVCCDLACGGTCEACAATLTGAADGACAPVLAMTDPGAECATASTASCGTNGFCDGAGACARWPAGSECAAPSCSAGTGTRADTCNGSGVCVDGGTMSCAPYVCGATGCLTSCSGPADCITGFYCGPGAACLPLRALGAICTSSTECISTFCADGVCCNEGCIGTCRACTAALRGSGSDGICGSISVGTDPENECTTQPASTCGTTGACSGAASCALYSAGTTCGLASCTSGIETHATTCDGAGTCVAPTTSACTPFTCGATACRTSCTIDTDCIAGDYCTAAGACVPRLANGSVCAASNECSSAQCVDGVCCGSACAGTCQSCAVPGSIGTCANRPAGEVDVGTCAAPNSCDGAGACVEPNGSSCTLDGECASAHCVDGVCCGTTCGGTCQSCAVPGSEGTCTNRPSGQVDPGTCVAPSACDGAGACLGTNGSACALHAQCLSGQCVDGVCCTSSCTGTCRACDVAGSVGVCTLVPDGSDPDNECFGGLACDGAGSCSL